MFNCKYCNQSFQFLVENVGDKKTPAAVDQPHTDKSFYENLPFHGLKQPPTEVDSAWANIIHYCVYIVQVISPRLSADMDYADADYKDLYVEGPLGYRKISEKNANISKSESNENGL